MAFTDHAVLLLPCWSDDDERPSEIGRRAVAALERRLGEQAAGLRVAGGIGDPQPTVDQAHVSYRQARLAAKVAGVVSTGSTCPRWRDLGVFRTLAQLPSWDCETDLDPRVQALFREADPDVLRSVETYLDLGCDVQRTSGELHLHRGTLYYRLDKAEKLSGLHLRDGNDRLSLHLGFKIARLAGRYPA
jgi:sugar diacid utilization regulator